jgi:hypothetical protein
MLNYIPVLVILVAGSLGEILEPSVGTWLRDDDDSAP